MSDARPTRSDLLPTAAVVERIDELLELRYRSADLGNLSDPLDEAVYILLSAQTREAVYQQVFSALKSRYPRWDSVLAARRSTLERMLTPGGLHRQRAAKLVALLRAVRLADVERGVGPAKGDDLTLGFLRQMDDASALQFLLRLPGIGPKSARCILSYSLGREAFAVDTHVRRILERLELVAAKAGKPAHDVIEELIPRNRRLRLHVNLVHHGRTVCRSSKPRCTDCLLVSFCGQGRAVVAAQRRRPAAVELFAGAGGLGLGFAQAGFEIALAVEQDRDAAQTYRLNHPGVAVLEADVRKVGKRVLGKFAPGLGEPELLMAGPPCQGYSHAGARDPDSPANSLYREVSRLAKLLKPQLVLVENVPGVRQVNGVRFEERIRRSIARAGYNVDQPAVLRAADFGVSQNRRRLVFLGRRRDLGPPPPPPLPTHRVPGEEPATGRTRLPETPRLADLLKRLPELPAGTICEDAEVAGKRLLNASTMAHSKKVVAKIRAIAPGQGPISYRRLEKDLARTLIAGHRALPVHPWLNRTISVREAAVIQGFPDWYAFAGCRANQPLQVANAVPPPLARALAAHLCDFVQRCS